MEVVVEVVVVMEVVVVEVVEVGHLSEVRGHILSCSRPSQAPSQLALVIGRTAGPDGPQVQMEASKLWSGSGLLDPEAQAKMFRARGGARGRLWSSKVTDTHTHTAPVGVPHWPRPCQVMSLLSANQGLLIFVSYTFHPKQHTVLGCGPVCPWWHLQVL